MFGVNLPEIAIVVAVALLLLRPRDVPRLARWAGAALRRLREARSWVEDAVSAAGAEPSGSGGPPPDAGSRDTEGGTRSSSRPEAN